MTNLKPPTTTGEILRISQPYPASRYLMVLLATLVTVVGGGALAVHLTHARLSNHVPTHWGWDGKPLMFSSYRDFQTASAALIIGSVLVIASFVALFPRQIRHRVIGAAVTLAVLGSLLTYGTIFLHSVSGAHHLNMWLWTTISALVAVSAGWLAFVICRPRNDMTMEAAPLEPLPGNSPIIAGSDESTEKFPIRYPRPLLWVFTAVWGSLIVMALTDHWVFLLIAPLTIIEVSLMSSAVYVTTTEVQIRITPYCVIRSYPLHQLHWAEMIDINPFDEFGGWGWRVSPDGTEGIISRAGDAVYLRPRIGVPGAVLTPVRPRRVVGLINARRAALINS